MQFRIIGPALLAAALLTPALAQAPPPSTSQTVPPPKEVQDPKACANAETTVGKGGDVSLTKPEDKSLSEKLAQSGGVICPPPHVDPGMKAPTPPGGPMPVIPPPGTPGGNPNVQPK